MVLAESKPESRGITLVIPKGTSLRRRKRSDRESKLSRKLASEARSATRDEFQRVGNLKDV